MKDGRHWNGLRDPQMHLGLRAAQADFDIRMAKTGNHLDASNGLSNGL